MYLVLCPCRVAPPHKSKRTKKMRGIKRKVRWTLSISIYEAGRQQKAQKGRKVVRTSTCAYTHHLVLLLLIRPKRNDDMRRKKIKRKKLYMQFLWTAGEDGKNLNETFYRNYKEKANSLYKKFCTRPSLCCHHLYKFYRERERKKVC